MKASLVPVALVVACASNAPNAQPPEHRVDPVAAASATEEQTPVAAVETDAGGGTPDAALAPCVGQAPPALVQAIQARAVETRRCYEQALRANPALAGRMLVTLRIADDGAVQKAELSPGEIDDGEMQNCIVSTFESGLVPAPEGGCVQVSVPLLFKPKPKSDAGTP